MLVVVANGEMDIHFVAQSRHQSVNGTIALTLDRHVLTVDHDLGEDARVVVVSRDFAREQLNFRILRQVGRRKDVPYLRR